MREHISPTDFLQQDLLGGVVEKAAIFPGDVPGFPEIEAKYVVFDAGDATIEHAGLQGKDRTADEGKADTDNWPVRELTNPAKGKSAYEPTGNTSDDAEKAGSDQGIAR